MRRVVFLGHSAQPSGAELGLLRLTAALTRYEPIVILAEHGSLVEQLRSAGVRCHVLELPASVGGLRHAEIRPDRQVLAAAREVVGYSRRLAGLIRETRPDIVDTFTLKAHVIGRLAQRGMSAPRVAHVHDRLAPEYMRRPSIVLLRAILGRCDGLVFNSESTARTVPSLRRGQLRTVVGSAIQPPPATSLVAPDVNVFTFGCVGRLTEWKGQRLALEAFAEVCRRNPDRELRMRFVGGSFFGEQAYVDELRTRTAALGLTDRVEWVGHVDDVYAELSRLDTLVHCSTVAEPFGQVIVEGMACGVPVVAPTEGGPRDLVSDGMTGLTFTPRDFRSLRDALERAMQLPETQRLAMTRAGHGVAERYYAPRVADRVERFYDEVLARAGETLSSSA